MNNERNALSAGLFIVISIIAAGAIVVTVKGGIHTAEPNQERQVTFRLTDDVSGIGIGDETRLGGYKVGTVKSIRVITNDTGDGEPRIIVGFSLPARYKLHADSIITVQSTLTGVPCLNIEHLGTAAETDDVVGQPGAFSTLTSALRTGAPELAGIVHQVRTITLPRANVAADNAGQALAQARDLLSDTKSDIRGTLAGLHSTIDSVHDKLPGILDQVKSDLTLVQATLDHAQSSLSDLSMALANARDITSSARSILVSNRGKIEGIITALKSTSDNLKGASVEIRQSPWRLLYKPTPDEMANLNLFDSTREFADGAERLNDAATALRDAAQDKQADPAAIRKLVQQLDESFTKFKVVEDNLWNSVK
jgi:ABC-type transporter Mla subunit MlaD